MFDAINTAATGLQTYHTWLDVIADNIANVNDVTRTDGQAFEQRYVQAQARSDGHGVEVAAVTPQAGNGEVVQDPTNPLADADGNVRRSAVDLSTQLGDLIMTQRSFQANANVVDRAKETYEAAIGIGKGL